MVNCFNGLHRGVYLVPCSFIVYLGYVVAIPCVFWVETWFYLSICYGLISYVLDTMFVCQMLWISYFLCELIHDALHALSGCLA